MGTVEEPGSWWTLREARVSSSRGHLRGERARDGALSPPPLTEVKPTDTEEVPGRWAQGPQGQQCPITGQAWDMLRDTRLTGERGTMVGGGVLACKEGRYRVDSGQKLDSAGHLRRALEVGAGTPCHRMAVGTSRRISSLATATFPPHPSLTPRS